MTEEPAIWGARLHHLRLNSDDPARLVPFYRDGMGLRERPMGDDLMLMEGHRRRLLLGRGNANGLGFAAFALPDADRLGRLRHDLVAKNATVLPSPSPLFADGAFAVEDPDGRILVFGLPAVETDGDDRLAGRLQHYVVATTDLPRMHEFYTGTLGFVVSDEVVDESDGAVTACFYRSDPEHHSFACFRAPEKALDHHAYETSCWNDIRDWADHFSGLRVKLWWGPGRHGPGDNLFFMVLDPDGNKVELSAELEHMPLAMDKRRWTHEERTLNYWGQAWMRS